MTTGEIEPQHDQAWLDGAMDTRETSDFTRVAVATLEAWRTRGGGPAFLKLGRIVRYRRRDVIEWMAQARHTSTSDQGGNAAA